MTLFEHICRTHPHREFTQQEGLITAADGLPLPTQQELDASYADALQAWQAAKDADAAAAAMAAALPGAREQMAAIMNGLNVEDRAYFAASRLAVEAALNAGDLELALYHINQQALPPDRPELVQAKADILALITPFIPA